MLVCLLLYNSCDGLNRTLRDVKSLGYQLLPSSALNSYTTLYLNTGDFFLLMMLFVLLNT